MKIILQKLRKPVQEYIRAGTELCDLPQSQNHLCMQPHAARRVETCSRFSEASLGASGSVCKTASHITELQCGLHLEGGGQRRPGGRCAGDCL